MIRIPIQFIRKTYRQLKNIRINIIFKFPPKTDVLIYGEAREEIIRDYVPSSKKIYSMNMWGSTLYLEPILILNIIRNFFKKELILSILIDGSKKGLILYFKDVLEEAIINRIKPKLVITYIDNYPRFGRLFSKFKEIRFIAIQNGCRSRWDTKDACKHDIYLSYTNQEPDLLNKLGWDIKEANNIGSLYAARSFATLQNKKFKNDLLIISCWRGNIEIDYDYLEQYKATKEMHIFLNSLINKEKYRAKIILRSGKDYKHWFVKKFNLNEEEYLKNIYGNSCEILENKHYTRNGGKDIYEEIHRSHLSVSFLTSAILEGHIYGHNCLYLNFYKNDFYHQDFPKEIVLSKDNKIFLESEIRRKINYSKKRSEEISLISKTKSKYTLNKFRSIISKYSK